MILLYFALSVVSVRVSDVPKGLLRGNNNYAGGTADTDETNMIGGSLPGRGAGE